MAVKFLRLRSDAKRAELIRVHNDTVLKLEAVIVGHEKKIIALEKTIAELKSTENTGEV